METLQNRHIKISVKSHGAELSSLVNIQSGEEMLWQGDPTYWKRQSPILFPIVGSVWNNHYTYNGKTYKMNQHGFARDMDFTMVKKTDSGILFQLTSNESTKVFYPADFILQIGYEIQDNTVKVIWNVINTGNDTMHFQIGAHPAFNYKNFNPEKPIQGYFRLLPLEHSYKLSTIIEKGCIDKDVKEIIYNEPGIMPITKETFNNDALILEDSQTSNITLLDSEQKPYIIVTFDSPVVGLWSPAKHSYAPFVCIEPWYGRCDKVNYNGDFANRDWVLHLEPNESFKTSYNITIL